MLTVTACKVRTITIIRCTRTAGGIRAADAIGAAAGAIITGMVRGELQQAGTSSPDRSKTAGYGTVCVLLQLADEGLDAFFHR